MYQHVSRELASRLPHEEQKDNYGHLQGLFAFPDLNIYTLI